MNAGQNLGTAFVPDQPELAGPVSAVFLSVPRVWTRIQSHRRTVSTAGGLRLNPV